MESEWRVKWLFSESARERALSRERLSFNPKRATKAKPNCICEAHYSLGQHTDTDSALSPTGSPATTDHRNFLYRSRKPTTTEISARRAACKFRIRISVQLDSDRVRASSPVSLFMCVRCGACVCQVLQQKQQRIQTKVVRTNWKLHRK